MSVFLKVPLTIDLPTLRQGISWAQSWATSPILFTLSEGVMRLIVVEQERFLACWSYPMPHIEDKCFFLIPSFVAKTLTGPAAWEAETLEIVTNRTIVGMILRDNHAQEFRLQWRWSGDQFSAPPYFNSMIRVPETIIKTSYVTFADVVHFAIHNLVNPFKVSEEEAFLQAEDAILIDFVPGQINIHGEAVTRQAEKTQYYFKPRLVVRGLEIVRERSIEVGVENVTKRESILYLNSQRDNWQIHCAILSVPVSNPVQPSPLAIQQKHPPMLNGSWFVPNASS